MDDSALLLWGVLFSSIGLGYFIYGRRQKHKVAFYTGLCLMAYPYFVADVLQVLVVGVVLLAVPRVVKT
ncbi:MAG: hypothetical protein ACE1Y4_13635 [Lysobacterales bacterium]